MSALMSTDGRFTTLPPRLIGRDDDVVTVVALTAEHRLVTLVGPGGSGKTTLALAVATDIAARTPSEVTAVLLQDVRERSGVMATIASELGIPQRPGVDLLESVGAYLAERDQLLVLDNFEQVLDAAVDVAALLHRSPGLRVIVTSRAPLRIAHEQEYEVGPLDDEAAAELFEDRARAVRSTFDARGHDETIAEIVRRVDGLPLAVGLAAAQTRLMTPDAILDRMDERLPTLIGGRRDAPARQRTQRATLDWSHGLLDQGPRRLFAALAVFVGGWTLDAAITVAGSEDDSGDGAVLEALTTLVEHNLVRVIHLEGADARYDMLQVTHDYARERLEALPDRTDVERRHATWVMRLLESAEPHLVLDELVVWQRRLRAEVDNQRAALRWAIAAGDAELAQRIGAASYFFWHYWGELDDGMAKMISVLDLPDRGPSSEHRVRATRALVGLHFHLGHPVECLELALEVVGMWRQLDDTQALSDAIEIASWAAAQAGDGDLAMRLTNEKW